MKAILSLIFILSISVNIYAQTAPDGVPLSSANDKISTINSSNTEGGEKIQNTYRPQNNNQNANPTDEYGSVSNGNYYLTGLGSTGNFLQIADDPIFDQNVDATIDAWIYLTSSNVSMIMTKGATTATVTFAFFVGNTGKLGLRMGNNIVGSDDANTIPLNTWTHVAVVWEDNGPNFDVRFYVDGLQSGTTQSLTGPMPFNADPVRIGSSEYNNGSFPGHIDEVRFWNPPLSQATLRANRFVGLGEIINSNLDGTNFSGSESYAGLIASWTFNSGFLTAMFDNVGGHFGILQGTATVDDGLYGYPMPYNNALYFPSTGGDDNLVNIRDTTSFSSFLTTDGTIEAWVRFTSIPASTTHLISKGSTSPTTSFLLGVNSNGQLFFNIAGNAVTGKGSLVASDWNHIAVTWNRVGGDYEINFFLNGQLDTMRTMTSPVMPVNSDVIRLGESQAFPGGVSPVNAYMDGVRFWNEDMELDTLKKLMFGTSSAIGEVVDNRLLASWGFDGHMVPEGRFTTMRGTFNTATSNQCRYSSYVSETGLSGNVISLDAFGHPTTIRRPGNNESAFPYGFYTKPSFTPIPDNNTTGVSEIITVGPSFPDDNVTSVELFLSIEGTRVGDLEVTLTAPNGQSRTVIANNGGTNNNVLTIFEDGASNEITSTVFLAPWANSVKPNTAFGNFDGSNARGEWTLKVVDAAAGTEHTLLGWGIRLNNSSTVGVQQLSAEIPSKFELAQNYPNPFNPTTSIKFALPKSGFVTLKVYDIVGKEVATLVSEQLAAGTYEHNFDASALSSGVYFYRIDAGNFTEIKKMMLVK
jgi:subtilisin-like proprotein convertase family protein